MTAHMSITQVVTYLILGGLVVLWWLVRSVNLPLQNRLIAWSKANGFRYHARAWIDLSQSMGIPLQSRWDNLVIADVPGSAVAWIYRKLEKKTGPRIQLQAEDRPEFEKGGDLCARITLAQQPSGRAIFVPQGHKPSTLAVQLAPSALYPVPCALTRYDMFGDGVIMTTDFPPQFFTALDGYVAKSPPTVVVDQHGLWIEDAVHCGSDEHGYASLTEFCQKVARSLAKWQFPSRRPVL